MDDGVDALGSAGNAFINAGHEGDDHGDNSDADAGGNDGLGERVFTLEETDHGWCLDEALRRWCANECRADASFSIEGREV